MKILKLTLVGYHRFMLNNINRLVYTPTADLQIILGTNGSGKSSLLSELSVFPAQSSDFTKDGMKEVEVSDNGHLYVIGSTFKHGTKHYFYKNGGENMNPGGTGSVQKELIRQEFGVTQDVHSLLTGETKFTDMPPNIRRQWITRLNSSDLTFATKSYNECRTLHRDALGAFKHIQTRLSVEVNKIADYADMEMLERQVRQMQEELTLLMENRELGLPGIWEVEQSLTSNLQRLEQISRQTMDIKINHPNTITREEAKYLPHVENALSEVRQNLSITESIHAHYSTEYAELDSVVSALGNHSESGEDLEERLASLEEEEASYLEKIVNHLIETNTEEIRNDTTAVLEQVVPILSSLPANPGRRFNPTQYQELRSEHDNTLAEINRLHNRVSQYESRKDHMLAAQLIACPKCSYTWKPGVSEHEVEALGEVIVAMYADIATKETLFKTQKETLDATEDYSTRLRSFSSIVNSYPRLSLLWQSISVEEVLQENPRAAIPLIQQWHSDVRNSHTLFLLRTECRVIRETLQHIRLLSQNDSSHVSERIAVLREHIETHTAKIGQLRSDQAELKAYRDVLVKVRENKAEILRLVQKVMDEQMVLQRIMRDQSLISLIGSHQTTLAMSQTRLNEKNTIQGIIADLKEDVDKVELEKISYQLLTEALSPSEGLIAEYLMDCIHSIVTGLNSVIGVVWTQPLIIQDCSSEDGELDYKFPMSVGNQCSRVEDISKGSSAQLDIVNFAFRILAYSQLQLNNYPLYLDELGKTFDEQHRINVMAYIRSCLDSKQFSQIFMISHYAGQYGSMANSETLVLDGTNISVPLIHNKHVIME